MLNLGEAKSYLGRNLRISCNNTSLPKQKLSYWYIKKHEKNPKHHPNNNADKESFQSIKFNIFYVEIFSTDEESLRKY